MWVKGMDADRIFSSPSVYKRGKINHFYKKKKHDELKYTKGSDE